jgi:glutamine amidotransferase
MKKIRIGIVDYDAGNLRSVVNALDFLDYSYLISDQERALMKCDFLVLPGVGAFDSAMSSLTQKNIIPVLNELVLVQKKPILGICVGMQLFAESSTEGGFHQGLKWIPGAKIEVLTHRPDAPVPHVGWNEITHKGSVAFSKIVQNECFYFDHSYAMSCSPQYIQATTTYGCQQITASVQHENIFGVQFHPEKSQVAGLKLLRGIISQYEASNA